MQFVDVLPNALVSESKAANMEATARANQIEKMKSSMMSVRGNEKKFLILTTTSPPPMTSARYKSCLYFIKEEMRIILNNCHYNT